MNYKQSIYSIKWSYIKSNSQYLIDSFSGERTELKNKITVQPCKSLFQDIFFDITKSKLTYLKKIVELNCNYLKKRGVELSVCLILHNEIVQINNYINDDRSYGVFRLIFKDNSNNMHIEDISITSIDVDKLEEKIIYCIKHSISFVGKTSKHKFINHESISVVLSPQCTGYFIHEILGHTLEEDFFSYYKNRYNNLKISNKLTVIDSGNMLTSFQKYDDTGIEMQPVTLIDSGKLCNILSTHAENSFDSRLYGVARRQSYKYDILPRMRGTFVKPFDKLSQTDILNKYDYAIFVNEAFSGAVDQRTGNYSLIGNGFIIKHGEVQNFIGNLRLHGNILSDLKKFEYIGHDLSIFNSYCKKFEQSVRVGLGGPTTSISNIKVSGVLYG